MLINDSTADNRTAVILSAGHSTRTRTITADSFKFMLPLLNMPLGINIIRKLYNQGIQNFVIVISPRHESLWKSILKNFFSDLGLTITIQVQEVQKGPGDALAQGIKDIDSGEITLFLADTLIEDNVSFTGDWIALCNASGDGAWCWVETDEQSNITKFYDKIDPPKDCNQVACGVYQFSNVELLKSIIKNLEDKDITIAGEYQISTILEEYNKERPLKGKIIEKWLDFGTAENYQRNLTYDIRSNKEIHEIKYLDGGIIHKKSNNLKSIQYELEWYNSLNDKKFVSPRVIEHGTDFYNIEFVDLPTLSYIYYYQQIPDKDYPYILSSLIGFMKKNVWNNLKNHTNDDEQIKSLNYMYFDKVTNRLNTWLEFSGWKESKNIRLNNKSMPRLTEIVQLLIDHSSQIIASKNWGFIHGDLNFSNILYSSRLNYFRLIDPRGIFDDLTAAYGGDIQYEYAKIRHSYHGLYEMFASDLYRLIQTDSSSFELMYPKKDSGIIQEMDSILGKECNLSSIKLLELGLFLSMLPLHIKQNGRDTALLLRAYQLADEILSS